jgi:membrane protein
VNVADRVEQAVDRAIERARKRSGLFDHVWSALVRFSDVLGGRLAAAISYYSFFAAFSLGVLAISIVSHILGNTAGAKSAVSQYLKTQLPWVAENASQVGGSVTVVASLTLLISGIGWVESLRSSLRAVWLLDQHPGHWILRRVVDLGMLVLLGVLLGLSLATTTAIDHLLRAAVPDTGTGRTIVRLVAIVLEFMINMVLASALLTAVSRMRLSIRRLVTPAVVIAVGIQILNTVGRMVITRTASRPAYDVVANAVGLLVYLYVLNQIILFGASLAATATAGTALDLGSGAAGISRGEIVPADGSRPEATSAEDVTTMTLSHDHASPVARSSPRTDGGARLDPALATPLRDPPPEPGPDGAGPPVPDGAGRVAPDGAGQQPREQPGEPARGARVDGHRSSGTRAGDPTGEPHRSRGSQPR